MIPVILSGGSGTRLWPMSRAARPKQFISLMGTNSLFQSTLQRLQGLDGPQAVEPLVICNEAHRFIVAEQCRELGLTPRGILLEPVGRNTAPAVAIACLHALTRDPEALLLVLPADHHIESIARFHEALRAGMDAARQGKLVTFGIVPDRAETGYGYLQVAGKPVTGQACAIERFVEKPDLATAQRYVEQGDHLWNSGMFLFRASIMLEELQHFAPDVVSAARAALDAAQPDLDFCRLGIESFASSPDISIDYAVMEKTSKAVVVPLDAGWSDVGAWDAVGRHLDHDDEGNALRGDVVTLDTQDSVIVSENRLVCVLGLKDVIVIDTPDALLVSSKQSVQHVKDLVAKLKAQGRGQLDFHHIVHRPWGSYQPIDHGERYQVKRITVAPGERLSVQMHHHRAEHWIVVSGTAKVTLGDQDVLLTENQSTYIPIGVVHALENPGRIPLELIEVQSGSYLGEDDIVRFDDRYGRR